MNIDGMLLTIASEDQADEIYHVMKAVYEQLEDKNLYVCDDLEYVKLHIKEAGFTVVACNEDAEIVGVFLVRYPGLDEDNLGRDIGMKQEQLNQVVHMESAVVLPQYRGRGLQQAMLKYAEQVIDKSKYKYFCATVSPDNPWSYHVFEKNGYQLKITKEKYAGLMRRIYIKEV